MPNNEKSNLIAEIRGLMNPIQCRQPSYNSYTANKVVDKLFVRFGIIAIIGLLGYIIIKNSTNNNKCRSD
ncbi:MAG: hypothetical protein V3V33_12515 [Candidatus Lokiarchaeia archaeon]